MKILLVFQRYYSARICISIANPAIDISAIADISNQLVAVVISLRRALAASHSLARSLSRRNN